MYPRLQIITIACGVAFQMAAQSTPLAQATWPATTDSTALVGTCLSADVFQQGVIADWNQLWQAQIPGYATNRPGSNPNQAFDVRSRNLHSLNFRSEPLYVVDGVPGVDPLSLDPNDIASVRILRDGVGMAQYGGRGAAGVVLIETRPLVAGEGWRVGYQSQVSLDAVTQRYQVADATEFVRYGGTAVSPPTSTDWQDEVLRPTAINQAHHLRLSHRTNRHGVVRAALHFRNHNGPLQKGDFGQYNGSFQFKQGFFQQKIQLSGGITATQRRADVGFVEAYRYALTANPTAPVRSTDPAYAQYGGFFEQELFDVFNPVAINELNDNLQQQCYRLAHARVDWQVIPSLRATVLVADDRRQQYSGVYASPESRWRNAIGAGVATSSSDLQTQTMLESSLHFNKKWSKIGVQATAGYSLQDAFNEADYAEAYGVGRFRMDGWAFDEYRKVLATLDTSAIFMGQQRDFVRSQVTRYTSVFGQAQVDFDHWLFVGFGTRVDQANQLGQNARSGWFPHLQAGVELTHFLKIKGVDQFRLRVAQGTSGMAPRTDGLSEAVNQQFIKRLNFDNGTQFYRLLNHQANPDLGWERHRERSLGLDINLGGRVRTSFDWFRARSSDLIVNTFNEFQNPPATWRNDGQISSRGFEATINAAIVQAPDFQWNVGFLAQRSRAVIDQSGISDTVQIGWIGAPGNGSSAYSLLFDGTPYGELYGGLVVSETPNANGQLPIRDLNRDGNAFGGDFRDMASIGNGLPDWELALHQQIKWHRWEAGLSLRAVVGHSMVNDTRFHYGAPIEFKTAYNRVITDYFDPKLTGFYLFSDYFVEDASFLRLQNVFVGYRIPTARLGDIRLRIGSQNLFTLTNYSGLDPEVRYGDSGPTDNGGNFGLGYNDRSVTGIDRRNTLPAMRSFWLSAGFDF
jgi:TonB-dependent starch-binding outer membrane protein SusC